MTTDVASVTTAPVVDLVDLHVHRGDVVALCDLDLSLPAGTSLGVIGPNGSGKSTLLGVLAGLLSPAGGSFRVRGSVALVLQSTDVDPSLPISVRDTVGLARYPSLGLLRRFRREDRDAVERAMARLDVADLAGRQVHELSGGQRQRVLVAQGLAQEADVLLLDEPVTGLDMASRQLILDAVDEERAAGRVVVMTTHNLEDARRCDQVLLLSSRPVAWGTPEEVLTEANLQAAFGGRLVRAGDQLLLDDPHHQHHG